MAKLFLLLLLCVPLASGDTPPQCRACASNYMNVKETKDELDNALKTLFKNSFFYLYSSYKFAGQDKERKGLAKYLRKMSDDTWEEGLECIKKILERGGRIDEIKIDNIFPDTNMNQHGVMEQAKDSVKVMIEHYNGLNIAATKENNNDADFALFFSKKMLQSTEKYRELVGHTIELNRLDEAGAGIALDIFDESL